MSETQIKVADETWLVVALLHRENPERREFTISEIVERADKERIAKELRPGVRVHATLHCVANLPPNPGRYRMLFATGKSTRRLFHPGDPYERAREGSKTTPKPDEIPAGYRQLLDWYSQVYCSSPSRLGTKTSILALRGVGGELWTDEDPDAYVRRLREGWQ